MSHYKLQICNFRPCCWCCVLLSAASGYAPAQRGLSWLKLKRDYLEGLADSIDLVPIGAWYGQGRKVRGTATLAACTQYLVHHSMRMGSGMCACFIYSTRAVVDLYVCMKGVGPVCLCCKSECELPLSVPLPVLCIAGAVVQSLPAGCVRQTHRDLPVPVSLHEWLHRRVLRSCQGASVSPHHTWAQALLQHGGVTLSVV
jgi:hypothetical protein